MLLSSGESQMACGHRWFLTFTYSSFLQLDFHTLSMPPLKCLSHTESGISYTRNLMSNLRYPMAAPPANPQLCFGRVTSFPISQFGGIFYCIQPL